MNILFIYMIKVAVYMIAFYIVYSLLLSGDTSYRRNRAFILLSLLSALILPFITFQTIKPLNIQFFGKFLSEVFVTATANTTKTASTGTTATGVLQTVYSIYIILAFIFIFKLLIDLFNLLFLILRHRNQGSRIIRFHGFNTSGFSAMGYIFINSRLSPEDAGEIIRHEQNHLKQSHFIDIIFIEIIKALQWFNPVIYLFNRSLRAIHEYQADQECLSSGVPIINYQSLLLNQVFKSRAFNLTNSFSNPSLIKKRMLMMTKKRTPDFAGLKMIIVVPVTAIVFLAISAYREIPNSSVKQIVPAVLTQNKSTETQTELIAPPPPPPPPPSAKTSKSKENIKVVKEESKDESETEPFVVVEEMPAFPGGDPALLKYIGENTIYPEISKAQNIQGRVIVRFCVTEKGGVSQISVLKGVSPELDAEAIRVVKTLPVFNPGKQGGKPVPVWYMVPITFSLR
jgi:TonB family protein